MGRLTELFDYINRETPSAEYMQKIVHLEITPGIKETRRAYRRAINQTQKHEDNKTH